MLVRLGTLGFASGALLLALAGTAAAQGAGGASCTVEASGLDFGQYLGASSAPSDITGTILVTCTATGSSAVPVTFNIALAGVDADGSRRIASGQSVLRYHLYLDQARTVPWGDGSNGTSTIGGSGAASAASPLRQSFTVYGRLLARQTGARAGRHSGVVPVLLTYQ
jgi:spore coat protein U-like protein